MICQGSIDGLAIDGGDGGDVVRRFEPALNFEGTEAKPDQLGDLVNGGQVLWGEKIGSIAEVAGLPVDLEGVRKAAGLGAFAPVGAAATEDLAGETLTGVGDAEGSMDKDLQREPGGIGGCGELGKFAQGKFPREDREVESLAAGEGDAFGRGQGHLGGGMELNLRANRLGEADEAEILDDESVNLRCGGEVEESFRLRKLRGEDKNVHCEVAASATGMEVFHDQRKIFLGEVFGAETRVEGGESEIDGVGAGGDGGLEAVPIAGWGKEFGPWTHE